MPLKWASSECASGLLVISEEPLCSPSPTSRLRNIFSVVMFPNWCLIIPTRWCGWGSWNIETGATQEAHRETPAPLYPQNGPGCCLWPTSKRVNTDTQPTHEFFNDISVKKKSFPVLRGPQFLMFGIGNRLVDPLLLKMSPLSLVSNQCACLLSESDYTRSALWLQLATRHCLLIWAPNTETGKSQGSYQGYLGDL